MKKKKKRIVHNTPKNISEIDSEKDWGQKETTKQLIRCFLLFLYFILFNKPIYYLQSFIHIKLRNNKTKYFLWYLIPQSKARDFLKLSELYNCSLEQN